MDCTVESASTRRLVFVFVVLHQREALPRGDREGGKRVEKNSSILHRWSPVTALVPSLLLLLLLLIRLLPPASAAAADAPSPCHCECAMLATRGRSWCSLRRSRYEKITHSAPQSTYAGTSKKLLFHTHSLSAPTLRLLVLLSPNARSAATLNPPVHDAVQRTVPSFRLARSGHVAEGRRGVGRGRRRAARRRIMPVLRLAADWSWHMPTHPISSTLSPPFGRTPFFSALCCVVYIDIDLPSYVINIVSLTGHIQLLLCDAPAVSAAVRHARQLRRHDALRRGPSPRSWR